MIVDMISHVGFSEYCRGPHVVFGWHVAKREAGVTPALPPQL